LHHTNKVYLSSTNLLIPGPPVCRPALVGRANLAPLDLAKDDSGVLLDGLNDLGVALGRVARTSVAAVEPVHEAALVPPDAHGQNHTTVQGVAHCLHAAELLEHGGAVGIAIFVVHGVGDVDGGRRVDFSVLDVFAVDGLEDAVLAGELSDDGEGTSGVDDQLGAVVILLNPVWVQTTAVLVAHAGGAAFVTVAAVETGLVAAVGGELVGAPVGLPDIHLVAADALALDVGLRVVSFTLDRKDTLNDVPCPQPRG
jgi:hypothetical protein